MIEELQEDVTPKNDEGEEQPNAQEEESDDELEKTKKVADNQKIRAEKAEKEAKELKAKLAELEKSKTPKKDTKEESNEPDYAKLAFLEGKGINNPDDQKLVQDEANRLKLPLTDILSMEHIKSKLKDAKDQREAEAGMPDGGGQGGKGTKNSIDYWVNKKDKEGNYISPPPEMGYEFAAKVVDARVNQTKKSKMFADDMY